MSKEKYPFDEALMPAEKPATVSDIELDVRHWEYARERWPDVSESMQAWRMRQCIWARFKHAEPATDDPNRRAFGGPQPRSGRPKKSIGEAIVEHFQSRTREVINAIAAPLDKDSGATAMERHKAGMNIAKHEREVAREQREADLFARLTEAEVRENAALELIKMIEDGDVKMEELQALLQGETITVEAEDITEAQPVLNS